MRAWVGRHDTPPGYELLFGLPGFDPPTEESDMIVGPDKE